MQTFRLGEVRVSGKATKRQDAILSLIAEQGFVATETLVRRFGVTPQTIRRDLNALSETHKIARFHGGAGQANLKEPYSDRVRSGQSEKRKIAEATAALIPDGASLFLNIGTTTEAVADALLGHRDLYVVTNNINVARILSQNDSFTIMLSGGQVRNHDGGLIGAEAVSFVDNFRMDFGVIGISAIDMDGSLLDFDAREIKIAQAIMRNSGQVVLVADSSKFGRRATNRLGHLRDLDALVTDRAPEAAFSAMLREGNVDTLIADGRTSAKIAPRDRNGLADGA